MSADLTPVIREALARNLEDLRDQIRTLVGPLSEQAFWTKPVDPGNSVGHLVLHLTGNLNLFVGAQLGGTGYVRDREREFTEPNPPSKAAAMAGLDGAVALFRRVVTSSSADQLAAPHPTERLGVTVNGLLFLLTHFALHRGQISYLVRLVKK